MTLQTFAYVLSCVPERNLKRAVLRLDCSKNIENQNKLTKLALQVLAMLNIGLLSQCQALTFKASHA